jgi:HlyD family secretion protein
LIVRRDRDPGGVVVPGSSILQMMATNEIWVSAWVDETAGARLAAGQPVRVVFRSEPAPSYPGEVARLGRETDRETREFLVDVRVKALPKNWTVGQRAEVYVKTGRRESTLALPMRFMSWRSGKPGAFVMEQGKAQWRELKLGLRGLESVEVTEGLAAGAVVCKPREVNQPLTDGQRVSAPKTAP